MICMKIWNFPLFPPVNKRIAGNVVLFPVEMYVAQYFPLRVSKACQSSESCSNLQ